MDKEANVSGLEPHERIKLRIEYAKLVLSILGLVTLVFAGLQWRASSKAAEAANIAANQAAYQRIASEWRQNLLLIAERPEVRPYFEDKKQLEDKDPQRNLILALADLRIDTMDAILTYAQLQGVSDDIGGWRRTFAASFQSSPILCTRLRERENTYGLIVPVAASSCR